jgi:dihydrofolate synthase/folylpolyglutamate synthase
MDNRLDHNQSIANLLQRFSMFHPAAMDLDLSRSLRLMDDLSNPHLNIPPVFHIAGTNGKGSSLAFLKAMLNENHLSCHVMTSPHLVEFRERFVVADQMISNEELVRAMEHILSVNQSKPATFFELITAVGFYLFANSRADFTLLETGMGGRLDATNIVPKPIVTMISMISMDHTQHLGNSIEKIAFEKAGIMKQDAPCVIGEQTKYALANGVQDVFLERARELNVPLFRHDIEWKYDITDTGFDVIFGDQIIKCPTPNLIGKHQYANAALAVMSYVVGGQSNIQNAVNSLRHANWNARLQKLGGGLSVLISNDDELWLDGGHNDSAGVILAEQIKTWNTIDYKKTYLILGMLNTKNPQEFFAPLLGVFDGVHTITIPDQVLSYTADELAARVGGKSSSLLQDAIRDICKKDLSPKRILITGSLYLAGYVLGID